MYVTAKQADRELVKAISIAKCSIVFICNQL